MDVIENKEFKISIEEGIICIEIKVDFVTYEIADAGVIDRLKLTDGKYYPMLSDITKVKNASKEARIRLSDKDAQLGVIACAIVIGSKAQQIMYNFFTLFSPAPIPTKMFTNREKAKEWLSQYKSQE